MPSTPPSTPSSDPFTPVIYSSWGSTEALLDIIAIPYGRLMGRSREIHLVGLMGNDGYNWLVPHTLQSGSQM